MLVQSKVLVVVVAATVSGIVIVHKTQPGLVLVGAVVVHPLGAEYAPVDQVYVLEVVGLAGAGPDVH